MVRWWLILLRWSPRCRTILLRLTLPEIFISRLTRLMFPLRLGTLLPTV
uniref:Uncharacterized protein n=1 Tax=Podoviridae sp. ct2iq11 TaxID=2827720 RepID=A0A8S5TPM2_9CAUD|nr:MAG TPA: hypothetical protein [Podoviridae sp. ct2iq11]